MEVERATSTAVSVIEITASFLPMESRLSTGIIRLLMGPLSVSTTGSLATDYSPQTSAPRHRRGRQRGLPAAVGILSKLRKVDFRELCQACEEIGRAHV